MVNEPQVMAFSFSSVSDMSFPKICGFSFVIAGDTSFPKVQAFYFNYVPPTTLTTVSINSQTQLL